MKQMGRALLLAGEGVIHVLLDVLDRLTGWPRDTEERYRAQYARERDADTWGRD